MLSYPGLNMGPLTPNHESPRWKPQCIHVGNRIALIRWAYVLRSSGINRKSAALIVRYSQKKKWISIVIYCSENPSIAHNLGTTEPIQVVFKQKCISLNEDLIQLNRKLKMSHFNFWLIPLDCITYDNGLYRDVILFFSCHFAYGLTRVTFCSIWHC